MTLIRVLPSSGQQIVDINRFIVEVRFTQFKTFQISNNVFFVLFFCYRPFTLTLLNKIKSKQFASKVT